jgi:hypothetical protein
MLADPLTPEATCSSWYAREPAPHGVLSTCAMSWKIPTAAMGLLANGREGRTSAELPLSHTKGTFAAATGKDIWPCRSISGQGSQYQAGGQQRLAWLHRRTRTGRRPAGPLGAECSQGRAPAAHHLDDHDLGGDWVRHRRRPNPNGQVKENSRHRRNCVPEYAPCWPLFACGDVSPYICRCSWEGIVFS